MQQVVQHAATVTVATGRIAVAHRPLQWGTFSSAFHTTPSYTFQWAMGRHVF